MIAIPTCDNNKVLQRGWAAHKPFYTLKGTSPQLLKSNLSSGTSRGKCLNLAFGADKEKLKRRWIQERLSWTVMSPIHELPFLYFLCFDKVKNANYFKGDATMCEAFLSNVDQYSHHSRSPLHPHYGEGGISCPGTVEDSVRPEVHLQGLRFGSHAWANCPRQTSLTLHDDQPVTFIRKHEELMLHSQ